MKREPGHESNLTASIREQVELRPCAPAFVFLPEGEGRRELLSYGDLDRGARATAAALQARGARRGDRAVLLLQPGCRYVESFVGCLYAGVVPVPAYPPDPQRLQRTLPRLRALAADAQPTFALTESWLHEQLGAHLFRSGGERRLSWLRVDSVAHGPDEWRAVPVRSEDAALIQYTSGSTGSPRGVVVLHRNLMANIGVMVRSWWSGADGDSTVSWLPPYHDMGLIGMILTPLTVGASAVSMAPYAFLQRPLRWLRALSEHGGVASAAPNFAYDLCVRKTCAEERATLDLTNWRAAINGAEPVRLETLRRFAEAFAVAGFAPEHMQVCFGMAECTLLASAGAYDERACVLDLDARALQEGRAAPATAGGATVSVVSCGSPVEGMAVTIVDPHTRRAVPDGRVGEMWIRGASVAGGYWTRDAETEETFHARRADDPADEHLRSGDLGFVQDGRLYVTGRLKDLLVVRGRNHYPHDIEHTAESADPRVRRGCSAAFAIDRETDDSLAVACEFAGEAQGAGEAMARSRAAILEQHGLAVQQVALLAPRTIPKTSSGKIQRQATRTELANGELTVIASWSRATPDGRPPACR